MTAELPVIDLSLLREETFILTRRGSSGSVHRQICDEIFLHAGFEPRILMETATTAHIVPMAQTCGCCGIIPRYYMKESSDLRYFVLSDHPSWHLYITHRKNAYLTQAARIYIRLAKEYWAQHLTPPQAN